MASKSFEDLIAWQKARALANTINYECRSGLLSKDYCLRNQMHRAAISIMANIAEGQERGTPPDFIRFLWIAKASCGELRSHFYLALDFGYITPEQATEFQNAAMEISKIIGGLISSLRKANTPSS
ncbi:MAG: four helix bundle protein [Gemmataceae bacterium]